jgi:hypothetical protein
MAPDQDERGQVAMGEREPPGDDYSGGGDERDEPRDKRVIET